MEQLCLNDSFTRPLVWSWKKILLFKFFFCSLFWWMNKQSIRINVNKQITNRKMTLLRNTIFRVILEARAALSKTNKFLLSMLQMQCNLLYQFECKDDCMWRAPFLACSVIMSTSISRWITRWGAFFELIAVASWIYSFVKVRNQNLRRHYKISSWCAFVVGMKLFYDCC